jgi:hypothetical protein
MASPCCSLIRGKDRSASLPPYSRRRRAAFRGVAPHGFEHIQRFARVYGAAWRGRIHGGAAIRFERIFSLADIPVFGNGNP